MAKKFEFQFEKVNTESLKSSIQELQRLFTSTKEKEVLVSLSKTDNWQTAASVPLINGLKKLIDERYVDLQKKLSDYLTIVSKIETYNVKKNKVLSLEKKINEEKEKEDPSTSAIKRWRKSQNEYLEAMASLVLDVDSLI